MMFGAASPSISDATTSISIVIAASVSLVYPMTKMVMKVIERSNDSADDVIDRLNKEIARQETLLVNARHEQVELRKELWRAKGQRDEYNDLLNSANRTISEHEYTILVLKRQLREAFGDRSTDVLTREDDIVSDPPDEPGAT